MFVLSVLSKAIRSENRIVRQNRLKPGNAMLLKLALTLILLGVARLVKYTDTNEIYFAAVPV